MVAPFESSLTNRLPFPVCSQILFLAASIRHPLLLDLKPCSRSLVSLHLLLAWVRERLQLQKELVQAR